MAKSASGIYVARESCVVEYDGGVVSIQKGVTRIREGHPLMQGSRADLWEPISEHVHFEWETATAAPGEKRGKASDAPEADAGAMAPAGDEVATKGAKEASSAKPAAGKAG